MRKTETREIGEFTYKVTQLGANEGLRLAARLAPVFTAFLSLKDKARDAKALDAALPAVLEKMLGQLTPEDIDFLAQTFAAVTVVSGEPYGDKTPNLKNVFSEHFAGAYLDLVKWLGFCLQLNFASFFPGLSASKEGATAAGAAPR